LAKERARYPNATQRAALFRGTPAIKQSRRQTEKTPVFFFSTLRSRNATRLFSTLKLKCKSKKKFFGKIVDVSRRRLKPSKQSEAPRFKALQNAAPLLFA